MRHALALIVCLGLAQTANAQDMSGGYIGFALGAMDYEEVDEDLGETLSDTSTAYRFLGGYRFTDNFAVEGGWARRATWRRTSSNPYPLRHLDS